MTWVCLRAHDSWAYCEDSRRDRVRMRLYQCPGSCLLMPAVVFWLSDRRVVGRTPDLGVWNWPKITFWVPKTPKFIKVCFDFISFFHLSLIFFYKINQISSVNILLDGGITTPWFGILRGKKPFFLKADNARPTPVLGPVWPPSHLRFHDIKSMY